MEKNQIFTRNSWGGVVSKGFCFILLVTALSTLNAQSKGVWKKSYDVKMGFGQGSRLLWATTPAMRTAYTSEGLSDSFRTHDQWTNLTSFGASVNLVRVS